MSAALLLNPLLGSAPVDPARPLSSEDAGFAAVLANVAGAGTGAEEAGVAAGRPAPAATPATVTAAVAGLVAAASGKGLAQPAGLKDAGTLPVVEAEVAPGAVSPASSALMPPVSPGALASATLPVADNSNEAGGAPEASPAGAAAPATTPNPAAALQAAAPSAGGAGQPAPALPVVAEASAPLTASAGLTAAVAPAAQATPGMADGAPSAAAPGAAADPLPGTPPQVPPAAGTPIDGEAAIRRVVPQAGVDGAPLPTPGLTPVKPEATAASALPDAPSAKTVSAAVTTGSAAVVIETSAASAAPASAVTDLDALAAAAPAAAASASIMEPKAAPIPTGPVQAQLAGAGAGLAPKPVARRADLPAAGEIAQPVTAPVQGHVPEGADLPTEIEPATPLTFTGGNLALNSQAGAAASPSQATATGAPVAAPAATEATPAALLAEVNTELSSLDAPTDLPAGEAPRLPEAALPTAASIVLQPAVNDGRFNAVAQISAQFLRRLEGQTTRFEMALTPEDLGRVDVTLEFDSDGGVTARLAFDNPAAAAELRAQADQLRRELEAAGLNVARDGLQFAERDARRDESGTDRRGAKAFAGAARLEADADTGVAAYRMTTADGRLDVRI